MKYLLFSVFSRVASACLPQQETYYSRTTQDDDTPRPLTFDSLAGDMFGAKNLPSAATTIVLFIVAITTIWAGVSYCNKQPSNDSKEEDAANLMGDSEV